MAAVLRLLRHLLLMGLPAVLLAAPPIPPAGPDPQHTGTPFMRAWSAEDYGGAPVNWHTTQDPRTGYIYAANNHGVLEFDGAVWRLIELPNEGRARTLVFDAQHRLWAAGDDIVRLEPDATGVLRAKSQLDRLPPAERTIGSVLFSAATPTLTAFAGLQVLLFFPETGEPFCIRSATNLSCMWAVEDTVYVSLVSGEVLRLQGRRLVATDLSLALPGTAIAVNRIVYDQQPAGPGRWRFATNRGVLTATRGAAAAELTLPLPPELIGDNQITAAVLLANGGFACATVRDGLIVFDAAGRFTGRIDRSHGLPGNRIDHLFEDREGGVWLAQRTGITRIQLDSPFAVHGVKQGIEGGPRMLLRHAGRLLVGHNEGLAAYGDDGLFREIPGMRLGANRLVVHADRLLVTSGTVRELLPDGTLHSLLRQPLQPLIDSRTDPTRMIGGNTGGVLIDRWEGRELRADGQVAAVPGPVTHLLDTGDGFVWSVSPFGAVWRMDFRAGVRADAPARSYGEADGLRPARRRDEPLLFELGGALLVSSAQWLLRYDRATDRFVPEDRIAGLNGTRLGATEFSRDEDGTVWLRLGLPAREIVRLRPAGPNRWTMEALPSAPLAGLVSNGLYPDLPLRTLWLAGQGSLVSVALDWKPGQAAPPLRVQIRRVETPDGTFHLDPAAAAPGGPVRLAARQNALHVAFAAPTYQPDYRGQTGTVYRTRLGGLESAWTDWSAESHRDFTNLPYRDFQFEVQARDLAGRTSAVARFAFTIEPPWWLSDWAYAADILLGGSVLMLLARLRTRALQRRNVQLAAAVEARTRELHQQNLELARLNRLELDAKISARLAEEKARLEVLRYQLNPHFLFNALNSVCAQINREPGAARAMVVRLADFCRLTLHRPGHDESAMTIGQEIQLLRAYLEIEQARLGELMSVEIQADPAADDVRIPPFLLLPLVENAVKYGAKTSAEHLTVRLTVRREPGGAAAIEVANTGEWLAPGAHSAPSHGIGLENLRQRLARYFPAAHELVTRTEGGWVIMRLRLLAPLHEHPHPDR